MSFVVRRKHVLKEMMEDDFELNTEKQQIVRVVRSRGNNLHEVETATPGSENFLASMPKKFRRNMWIKRGDYVLVEPIEEGVKVKAEICKVLTAQHVKEYTKAGVWPKQFSKTREHEEVNVDSDEENNGNEHLMKNPNRPVLTDVGTDDDDSASDDDDSASDNDDNIASDDDDDSVSDEDECSYAPYSSTAQE